MQKKRIENSTATHDEMKKETENLKKQIEDVSKINEDFREKSKSTDNKDSMTIQG